MSYSYSVNPNLCDNFEHAEPSYDNGIAENENLPMLVKSNEQLEAELRHKEAIIRDLEQEKEDKEIWLKTFQYEIEKKVEATEREKMLQQGDRDEETEWTYRTKQADKDKVTKYLEYQRNMGKLLEQVYETDSFSDVSQGIEQLKQLLEGIESDVQNHKEYLAQIQEVAAAEYGTSSLIYDDKNFMEHRNGLKLENVTEEMLVQKMEADLGTAVQKLKLASDKYN